MDRTGDPHPSPSSTLLPLFVWLFIDGTRTRITLAYCDQDTVGFAWAQAFRVELSWGVRQRMGELE